MTGFISPGWFRRWAALWSEFGVSSLVFGGDAEETDGPVSLQVFGGDEVSAVHAGNPDALSRLLAAAREGVGKAAHDSSPDSQDQLERGIEKTCPERCDLHPSMKGEAYVMDVPAA